MRFYYYFYHLFYHDFLIFIYLSFPRSDFPEKDKIKKLAGIPILILGWESDDVHPLSTIEELKPLLGENVTIQIGMLKEG